MSRKEYERTGRGLLRTPSRRTAAALPTAEFQSMNGSIPIAA